MKFSQRIGKKSVKTVLQMESMDQDLKNSLWNVVHHYFINDIYDDLDLYSNYYRKIWRDFLKLPIDDIPIESLRQIEFFKIQFFGWKWFEVYDFIEFIPNLLEFDKSTEGFKSDCNVILKRECAGYRFIADEIAAITDDTELKEIQDAIDSSEKTNLPGVNEHLNSALEKLSNRKQPDYRNSIKESISAIESICQKISGNPKASLGEALNEIERTNKIKIHNALNEAFKKIFGYTSDEGGIRHAMLDESNIDFEDAKYMLVSCSAFINYLKIKANKADIKL